MLANVPSRHRDRRRDRQRQRRKCGEVGKEAKICVRKEQIETVRMQKRKRALSAVADGPARRTVSRESCSPRRWTLGVINWPRYVVGRTSAVVSIVKTRAGPWLWAVSVGLSGYCTGHYPSMHAPLNCRGGDSTCDLTFAPSRRHLPLQPKTVIADTTPWFVLGQVRRADARDGDFRGACVRKGGKWPARVTYKRRYDFITARCIRGTSHGPVSVRPSRLNVGSHKQHHTIAQGL